MYFPYLRGKQFELIAVRELIENDLISNDRIIPVIEPIKLSSTLRKTIEVAEEKEFRLALIFNPEVGDVTKKRDEILDKYLPSVQSNALYFGYITNQNIVEEILDIAGTNDILNDQILLVHQKDKYGDQYNLAFPDSNNPPAFNLIPSQRTYGRKVKKNKILLEDRFTLQKRNVDYAKEPDEFFTEDHQFVYDEGFLGFSDYLTIGSKFKDGGFRPYAVVIHITHFDSDRNIRIKHFVSDSNDDTTDTPRKFYEALGKLIEWKNGANISTHALGLFQDHYDKQTYPALGSLKKLSIMHHIELVDLFLKGLEP